MGEIAEGRRFSGRLDVTIKDRLAYGPGAIGRACFLEVASADLAEAVLPETRRFYRCFSTGATSLRDKLAVYHAAVPGLGEGQPVDAMFTAGQRLAPCL